jgi:hypothetical protein
MKYKVIVYYDNMEDSEHVFSNKNEAINEMHRGMRKLQTLIILSNRSLIVSQKLVITRPIEIEISQC